ncbi:hypothetical protein PGTUg99_018836 [Puccinia graminis f. sp. tritici]|uniref:Uncharacterized protein n=1 Tax=Puccinia graminis f. sp. tritici TaxID=56615 RepID=A0A5B0SAS3_PUCGR|nr:hypothetical protein PGTUg99_018836 [Puccinia graminis f. sp. tritici]
MTSRQHLRGSQFRFRAKKARFPCKNLDFLGLNRKLRGSQIRREVLQSSTEPSISELALLNENISSVGSRISPRPRTVKSSWLLQDHSEDE